MDALHPSGKAWISGQLRLVDRRDQSLPEFFHRGEVQSDQFIVGAVQRIGLRQSRPVSRARIDAADEVMRKLLDREVHHRLDHRYFQQAPRSGAIAFVKGAENTAGGVETGYSVGDGWSDD